ncbi:unnamed protein product, partial [Polarella glacialis]
QASSSASIDCSGLREDAAMPAPGGETLAAPVSRFRLILSDKLISGGQRVQTFAFRPTSLGQIIGLLNDHFGFQDLCARHGSDAPQSVGAQLRMQGRAEDSLKVLPGNLRKSAAAVLDQQGLDRASRQDCVVILDAALKEAAKTLPRLVSKVSGRLGGLPVAAKGKGTGRTADAGPRLDLHGECGLLITTSPHRGRVRQAVQEFKALAAIYLPWLTITEVQGANSGLFLAKGWQSRSDISQ